MKHVKFVTTNFQQQFPELLYGHVFTLQEECILYIHQWFGS